MYWRVLAGVSLSVLFAAFQVEASVLDNPHITGGLTMNFAPPVTVDFFGAHELSVPVLEPSGFFTDTTLRLGVFSTPAPALYAEVSVSALQNIFGHSGGLLNYELQPIGPAGPVSALAFVSGAVITVPGTGGALPTMSVKATWRIEDKTLGLVPIFGEGIDVGSLQSQFEDNFTHTVGLTLAANHVYRVTLVADASASGGDFGAFARAVIDPVFSFAPGTDPAYSFLFSDGIGNSVASVPEPGTLFLLGTAVLAIGLLRRGSGTNALKLRNR